ncbi:hypothetical protein Lalb_Chr04g0255981 [Lupinus albus]|uniref:S-protein homolog n=1 Tax=Lupinus albus TaxID=3870 RepID=A0A6A4QQI1_LUPAL|nr:hypothetical protein Lalb_Chr04g0255981 [Lupinus albus]
MTTVYYIALFLVLACTFSNTINAAPGEVKIGLQTIIPTTGLVHFSCDSGGRFDLNRNEVHDWTVPSDKIEHCFAVWNQTSCYFNAYDDSDKGHFAVHWIVEEVAFYRSQDDLLNWELRAQWGG